VIRWLLRLVRLLARLAPPRARDRWREEWLAEIHHIAEVRGVCTAGAVILPLVAVFMTVVGLLAALGPARRGLRLHPTDALRDE